MPSNGLGFWGFRVLGFFVTKWVAVGDLQRLSKVQGSFRLYAAIPEDPKLTFVRAIPFNPGVMFGLQVASNHLRSMLCERQHCHCSYMTRGLRIGGRGLLERKGDKQT